MASSSSSPPMKGEKPRNWADLPPEITSSILSRLTTAEILVNAQRVCRSWRRVCKDPSMWRKIDMQSHDSFRLAIMEDMCEHLVDRSEGGLLEFKITNFGTDSLLNYVAERSRNLTSLGLVMYYYIIQISNVGLLNAVKKFPLLEDLELAHCYIDKMDLRAVGLSCPHLKTLKLSRKGFKLPRLECDDDALAIAETMPKLRHLQLFGNRLTDSALVAILDNCPHLEHLDLRQCFNIELVGDLEKRCLKSIKDVRRPYDSTADCPFDATFLDEIDLIDDYYRDYPYDENAFSAFCEENDESDFYDDSDDAPPQPY